MADEAKATEYRVLKAINTESLDAELVALPEGTRLFALLPDAYTGNVRKAAHEAGGDGDYAKVAARSFDEFPARAKTVVSFS